MWYENPTIPMRFWMGLVFKVGTAPGSQSNTAEWPVDAPVPIAALAFSPHLDSRWKRLAVEVAGWVAATG